MGLREEIEREMHEAAGRSAFLLNKQLTGGADPINDPLGLIREALQGLLDLNRIIGEQVLRLADEIDALK